jgi:tetratricopeptide (TPR) repeat protein
MKLTTVCLFVLVAHTLTAQTTHELLTQLDSEISKRAGYVEQKWTRIDSLKLLIPKANHRGRYQIHLDLYNEYKSFVYDSAFVYARKLRETANELHGPVGITNARIKIGFVLLSAGMFNEALDTLRSVRSKALPDSIRTEYFYLMARTCYDLADFNRHDLYRKLYTQRANNYIDSALSILPSSSVDYLLMSGLRNLHLQQMDSAQTIYEKLLARKDLGKQEFAIVSSTLSFIYFYSDQQEKAKQMLIQAAIADIRSSTKETVAMQNLADMFYKEGETGLAYRYIQFAREDADFYGARQRQAQVGAIIRGSHL